MRRLRILSSLGAALALSAGLLLAACNMPSDPTASADMQVTVTKAAASAESSVTIAAKGLTTAVQLGAIKPGGDAAKAAHLALDGASKALDAAEAYIAAGLYEQAQAQIDSANRASADVDAQTGTADPDLASTQ